MWAQFALQGGLALLQSGAGYLAAKNKANSDRAWQKYRNAVTRMSGAMTQNAIQTNELLARENSIKQGFLIQKSAYATAATAEVAAAAVGAKGNSVNMTLFEIEKNAADAQRTRQVELERQYLAFNHERQNTEFATETSIDYSPIPMPNPVTHLLSFGTEAVGIAKTTGVDTSIGKFAKGLGGARAVGKVFG